MRSDMITVKQKALCVLAEANRPMTTMEVVREVFPDVPSYKEAEYRARIYYNLDSCVKWGEVKKTSVKGKSTTWELIA